MAKGILKIFGGLLIGIGILVIVGVAFITEGRTGGLAAIWPALAVGGGFLIAGAPLLGFAQVIDLLEEIARNSRGAPRG